MDIVLKPIDEKLDNDVIKWMGKVYENIPDKSLMAYDTQDELKKIINVGRKYSCLAYDDKRSKIAGIFLVNFYDLEDPNFYGYYCGLSREQLVNAAVMDIAMVDDAYRGLSLQKKMMAYVENNLFEAGFKYLLATVSPKNKFSYNNIVSMGYTVKARRALYGGLDRYILLKEI